MPHKPMYNEEVVDAPIPPDRTEPVSMPRLYGNLQIATNSIAVGVGQDIQKAIDAVFNLGGGTVTLASGTYLASDHIYLKSGVKIVGNGSSVIDFKNGAYQIKVLGSDAYTTGTVSITSGTTALVGVGTAWTSAMEGLYVLLEDFWYLILTVTSTTGITLGSTYIGVTLSGSTYVIAKTISGASFKGIIVQNSSIALVKIQYCNGVFFDGVILYNGLVGIDGDDSANMNFFNSLIDACGTGVTMNNFPFGTFFNNLISNITSGGGLVFVGVRNVAIDAISLQSIVGDAINMTSCSNNGIANFAIIEITGQGVEFVSNNRDMVIENGYVGNCTSDGVKLTATSSRICVTTISFVNNGGYGINIAASSNDDNIIYPNTFSGNTSGTFQDLGTRTITGFNTKIKARAFRSGTNQVLTTGVNTKIQLNGESYDPGGHFDSTTNHRFTAPQDGFYAISAGVYLQTPADQSIMQLAIFKNGGTEVVRSAVNASGTSDASVFISDALQLVTGDYIELFFTQTSGGNRNVLAGDFTTFLTIYLTSV